jgi:hypothetical protein
MGWKIIFVKLGKLGGFTAKRCGQGEGSGSDPLDHDPAAGIDCGRGWWRLTAIDRGELDTARRI